MGEQIALTLGKFGAVIMGVLTLAGLLTWAERKQSAVMQDRIGANRASIFGLRLIGLFHPIADGIKLITKEDFVPDGHSRLLHHLAPFLTLFFALLAFAAIPFGPTVTLLGIEAPLQAVDLDIGLIFVFAVLSLAVYGVTLGGWVSRSPYALLGGLRASAQMISYEISLGASVLGVVMIHGSLNLNRIVEGQGGLLLGFLPHWGIFLQPLGFVLFLIAAVAETKRTPFDLPEGESEIVGYFTEYSGMKFGMFMMTDFVETVLASALCVTLFLGGWQFPYLGPEGFHFPVGGLISLPGGLVAVIQVASFGLKVVLLCWFLLLVRWTLPRFRYDQLMRLGWRGLLPLALLNIFLTGAVVLLFDRLRG